MCNFPKIQNYSKREREREITSALTWRAERAERLYRNLNPRKRGPEIVILLPPSLESAHFLPVRLSSVNYTYRKYKHGCVCVSSDPYIYNIHSPVWLSGIKILYDRPYMIYSSCPVCVFISEMMRTRADQIAADPPAKTVYRYRGYTASSAYTFIFVLNGIPIYLCVRVYARALIYIYVYIFSKGSFPPQTT